MILSILVSAIFFSLLTLLFILFNKIKLKKIEKRFSYEVNKANLYKAMVLNRNRYTILKLDGHFKKNPELRKYIEKSNSILHRVGTEFDLSCIIRQTAKNDKEEEKRFKIFMKELNSCTPEVKELINAYNSNVREIVRLRFPWVHRNIFLKIFYLKVKLNFFYKPILYLMFSIGIIKNLIKNGQNSSTNNFKFNHDAEDILNVLSFSDKIGSSLQH